MKMIYFCFFEYVNPFFLKEKRSMKMIYVNKKKNGEENKEEAI